MELLGLDPVSLSLKRSRLEWSGNVQSKDDADWLKLCMKIEFEGSQQRGLPSKSWWDCVKGDMESFGLPVRTLRIGIIRD